MPKPIRVLHIFGALNPGGVELLVMNIYRCIDREKVQFDFALTEGKKSFFDDEVLSLGGRIFYFDKSKSMMSNLSQILATKGPFKVMHSHLYFYSGAILSNAKRHGVPIRIAHAHNTSFGQVYTLKRRAYEWLMRKLILQNATDLLGCSTDACEFVFGDGCMNDPRCSVMYNGFDVDAFAYNKCNGDAIRKQYGIEDKLVVGHVGRFEEQKNHTQLVEQFAAIKKRREDAVLLCVGRGSLMAEIRAKCEKLGVSDSVIFAGAQKDTPSYYSAMDVFLFPSLYEGLGSVLIEAQANGLHVVTSKTVVPGDINVTGNATFVPLEVPADGWAEAVLASANRSTDNTENEKVKQLYDIKTVTNGLCKIYFRD